MGHPIPELHRRVVSVQLRDGIGLIDGRQYGRLQSPTRAALLARRDGMRHQLFGAGKRARAPERPSARQRLVLHPSSARGHLGYALDARRSLDRSRGAWLMSPETQCRAFTPRAEEAGRCAPFGITEWPAVTACSAARAHSSASPDAFFTDRRGSWASVRSRTDSVTVIPAVVLARIIVIARAGPVKPHMPGLSCVQGPNQGEHGAPVLTLSVAPAVRAPITCRAVASHQPHTTRRTVVLRQVSDPTARAAAARPPQRLIELRERARHPAPPTEPGRTR